MERSASVSAAAVRSSMELGEGGYYLVTFDDGSTVRIADNPADASKVFNTPKITRAIYDLVSELARNVDSGTWCASTEAP